jgi:hypothetical protein
MASFERQMTVPPPYNENEGLDVRPRSEIIDSRSGRVIKRGGPYTEQELKEKRDTRDEARRKPPVNNQKLDDWKNEIKELMMTRDSIGPARAAYMHYLRDYPQSAAAFTRLMQSDNQVRAVITNDDGTPVGPSLFGGYRHRSRRYRSKRHSSKKRRNSRRYRR